MDCIASLDRPCSRKAGPSLRSRQRQSVFDRDATRSLSTMRVAAWLALVATALADVTPVDDVRIQFYNLEYELWGNVTDTRWRDTGLGGDIELTKAFTEFDSLISRVPVPPRPPVMSWLWDKAIEKLQVIEGHYKSFVQFVSRQSVPGAVPAPVREWLDVAENVLMDPDMSVSQAVRKLDGLLEHGDLFRSILQENHPDLCGLQISPHQLIYDMYNTISLTEIKGYAMMQFSWMLLRIYGKGNFVKEASLTRERYGERTSKTAAAARAALAMASRDIYTCDPHDHVEGVTYAQVTRLLQGFVVNEVDLNPESTCRDNCAAYTLTKTYGCFKDQYCARQQKCEGRVLDCQYVDSDMWICPASNSHRRYEWIEYENGMTLGRTGRCTRGTTKVDSWWRWLFWHCSYCMCLCDETSEKSDRFFSLREATSDVANNKSVDSWWRGLYHCSYCVCLCEESITADRSDRTFSLREAVSDIKKNKVVTGVRIVKIGRVFHLQINEGTLSERGNVLPGDWVAVQPFDPSDTGVTEGIDHHTLTYEKRGLDLDELHSPSGHILTGIRFHMLGSHLHFEIRSTPFNYTTGRMIPEKSQWISNDNTEGSDTPRDKLELIRPDIPIRGLNPLPLDSRHDQYIEFTNSDLEADAAQSTVPFIDIQPLLPLKGASLNSGAGVVHRGVRGSGGFVALKLIAYEQTKHVQAEPPHSQFDVDADVTEFPSIVN